MRILPSWSSGTKRNVGSSSSLTISRSSPRRSRIAFQYSRLAPPSGSTPSFRPAPRIASRSITAAEVVDVGADVVALGDRRVGARHVVHLAGVEELVGAPLDPARHVGVGRAAVRRVVLEAAVAGRVVRGGDDDPVRDPVVGEDRVGDDRRRRRAAVAVHDDVDAPRGEDGDDRVEGRDGEGVRVAAEEERAVDPLLRAVLAHRGADGDDVRLGEGAVERGAAVAGGAERDGFARRAARTPRAGRRRPRGRRARAAGRHADRGSRGEHYVVGRTVRA